MDTLIIPQKKIDKATINAVGLGIVISLMFTQNLFTFAKDLGSGNYTGISPALTNLIENQTKKEIALLESQKKVAKKENVKTIEELPKTEKVTKPKAKIES